MINAAFFVSKLDSGGMENYLLRFLTKKHHCFDNVYVWCKSGQDGQLDNSYTALSNVTLVKDSLGYFNIISHKRLCDFLKQKKIDVVCDFSGNFSGTVILSAKKAGVNNRVAAYRCASDRFKKDPIRNLYNQWARSLVYKYATNIIANSESGFDYFFSPTWKKDKRFSVIYNGVDSSDFLAEQDDLRNEFSIPSQAYVVGHTGRFNPAKNHSIILLVVKILVSKYPDIYFILCGNGVKDGLMPCLKKLEISDQVLVFENRSDIPKFLNTMNCYFFPSVTEGQPNALIEAMIMGLPFIASDIAPIRETVGDGYPLYPPLDVSAFSDAIEEKYLAREGRDLDMQKAMVERFDYRVRFEEFYQVLSSSESVNID
ncbi:glycosyltransferase [Halomonas sp. RA08-2]|uniref:glycosyltransferase n=1 Tax=Halomonas sp. RA08-2 TaxID=3440842 RepID=UPI003EEC19F1